MGHGRALAIGVVIALGAGAAAAGSGLDRGAAAASWWQPPAFAYTASPSHGHAKGTSGPPLNCADLSAIPRRYDVSYDEIAQAWAQGGCTGCHNQDAAQNGGSLRLDGRVFGIVGLLYQPSFRNPDLFRVLPGEPNQSLAYTLMNCDPPPTYLQMPISGRTFESVRALVYDWIDAGAPAFEDGTQFSDVVFRSGLESERF